MNEKILDVKEAARLLRVEAQHLEEMAERGEVPGVKLEGNWVFTEAKLASWLDEVVEKADSTERAKAAKSGKVKTGAAVVAVPRGDTLGTEEIGYENYFEYTVKERDLVFVVKGTVRVLGSSEPGGGISFTDIHEGDFFGEVAAVDGGPRSAVVTTVVDCELAFLSPDNFLRMMEAFPPVSAMVMLRLTETVRRLTDRLVDLTALSTNQRICREILRRLEPDPRAPSGGVVRPRPDPVDLAGRASATPEAAERVLTDLITGGAITEAPDGLTVPDRDLLELLTENLARVEAEALDKAQA